MVMETLIWIISSKICGYPLRWFSILDLAEELHLAKSHIFLFISLCVGAEIS